MSMLSVLLLIILLKTTDTGAITITKYATVQTTHLQTIISTKFYTTTSILYHSTTGTLTESAITRPTSLDTSFQTEILSKHNELRTSHGVAGLNWSSTLYEEAQKIADNYVCDGELEHSDLPFGENLALGYNTSNAVMAWYNEYVNYNYTAGIFSENTGHFTQLVWKNTTELGCAYVICGQYYGQYTVCEYKAPGNVLGHFTENVLPLIT